MADKFKFGDVVRLKSGGPAMTITNPVAGLQFPSGYVPPHNVTCAWFDITFHDPGISLGGNSAFFAAFHEDSLEIVNHTEPK